MPSENSSVKTCFSSSADLTNLKWTSWVLTHHDKFYTYSWHRIHVTGIASSAAFTANHFRTLSRWIVGSPIHSLRPRNTISEVQAVWLRRNRELEKIRLRDATELQSQFDYRTRSPRVQWQRLAGCCTGNLVQNIFILCFCPIFEVWILIQNFIQGRHSVVPGAWKPDRDGSSPWQRVGTLWSRLRQGFKDARL